MRKIFAILVGMLLLVPLGAALAEGDPAGEELLYNGDFAQYADSARLPSGWEFEAYDASASDVFVEMDETYGVYVGIQNTSDTDARAYQNVTAVPNTVYRLTATVRTWDVQGGTGASLSIDNYAVDGTYCYSQNLHGDNDWQQLTMYVRTGAEQELLRVALRLGGYGTTARGEADFCGVSLQQAQPDAGVAVIDLATENGTVTNVAPSETKTEIKAGTGLFIGMSVATALCIAAFAALYWRVLRFEGAGLPKLGEERRFGLPCILIAAFVLRFALSLIFYGHSVDLNCFMAWGNAVLERGVGRFYTSDMFTDYPPGYMYVCGFLAWICRLLGLPYGSDGMAFVFKLPATFADLTTAYLVYRMVKKLRGNEAFALVLAGVIAFNPALMFVSGAWGQIDTLLTLLLALTCDAFINNRKVLAGAMYGLAILFKPQALMLGPLLATAYLADALDFKHNWMRALLDAALAVVAALAVLELLSLPFQSTQPWYWLIERYRSTAGTYQYASVEAFNLFSMLGGNWKPITDTLLGMPYSFWGTAGIVLSILFSAALYVKGRRDDARAGALYLAGAVLIAGVFTLGHYMHERYIVPTILLLLLSYLYYEDRRILVAFGALGSCALYNILAAMFIVGNMDLRGGIYDTVTFVGSLAEVMSFAYLCYVSVQIVFCNSRKPKLEPVQNGRVTAGQAMFGQAPLERGVLPEKPFDSRLHYTRRDWMYVLGITVVYGVVALLNLGTTHAPQTVWEADRAGETVTVDFGDVRHIEKVYVYGNIQSGGTLLIEGGGAGATYEQTFDDMFRWKPVELDFVGNSATVSVYSGALKFNEIAFLDAEGKPVAVTLEGGPTGSGGALFDEQDTVPAIPSYYNGMYFDELYHGRTAYEHLYNLAPYENSHPPLGKLLIMLGIAVFGMCPFGWRVVGALFGVGMLPILYAFGKRIFKNSEYALLATGLFAFDFMHFTQTRIATIDVYAVFFILLMYYYMYQYLQMNFFVDGLRPTYRPLALSGLFFGVGTACKWTCIYAGAGLAVLFFYALVKRYFEYVRLRKRGSAPHKEQVSHYWEYTLKTCGMCCLFFIAIPFAIYFLSYIPYFVYESGQSAGGYGVAGAWKTWWKYQQFMYSYHSTLNATHPYQSLWYQWPFTVKPIWYYFNSYAPAGSISTLSASGNPAVWWVCTIGTVAVTVARCTRRIKPDRALAVLCVGVLANYLPWVLVSRCTFIYHFFATVPFLILASVYGLQKLDARFEGLAFVKWAWLAFAIVFFALLYPGLSGLMIPAQWAAALHQLPGGKLLYGAP